MTHRCTLTIGADRVLCDSAMCDTTCRRNRAPAAVTCSTLGCNAPAGARCSSENCPNPLFPPKPAEKNLVAQAMVGWICPTCRKSVSPYLDRCPC